MRRMHHEPTKRDQERRVIIKGILSIMRRQLNKMDDLHLQQVLVEAWKWDSGDPNSLLDMDTLDIHFQGMN